MEAERYYTEALQTFTTSKASPHIAHIHVYLARLMHEQGKEDVAISCLTQARTVFQTLCLSRYVEQTEQLAQEWGRPFPRTHA